MARSSSTTCRSALCTDRGLRRVPRSQAPDRGRNAAGPGWARDAAPFGLTVDGPDGPVTGRAGHPGLQQSLQPLQLSRLRLAPPPGRRRCSGWRHSRSAARPTSTAWWPSRLAGHPERYRGLAPMDGTRAGGPEAGPIGRRHGWRSAHMGASAPLHDPAACTSSPDRSWAVRSLAGLLRQAPVAVSTLIGLARVVCGWPSGIVATSRRKGKGEAFRRSRRFK